MTSEKALSGRRCGKFEEWVAAVRQALADADAKRRAGLGEGRIAAAGSVGNLDRLREALSPEEWARVDLCAPPGDTGPAYRWDSTD